MRAVLRGIFGLSVLLAGGGAQAGVPTTPQSIALLHSFDPNKEGSYPVPGLTLDGANALWGVLTVPHHGSLSESAPGMLFKVNGLNSATGSGTTGISVVGIPARAGSDTYYALSFSPNLGTGSGLFFGTSLGDTSAVAGRPRRGAIFQFDPVRGTASGNLAGEGFAVLADFDDGRHRLGSAERAHHLPYRRCPDRDPRQQHGHLFVPLFDASHRRQLHQIQH
jgi:hypothetical protein